MVNFCFVSEGIVFVEDFLSKAKSIADGRLGVTERLDCIGECHIDMVHRRDNSCQVRSATQEEFSFIL